MLALRTSCFPADSESVAKRIGLDGEKFGRDSRRADLAGAPLSYCSGMKVLVTGGAGYIGAITAAALERGGHTPVILDSLLSGPEAFVAWPDLLPR